MKKVEPENLPCGSLLAEGFKETSAYFSGKQYRNTQEYHVGIYSSTGLISHTGLQFTLFPTWILKCWFIMVPLIF